MEQLDISQNIDDLFYAIDDVLCLPHFCPTAQVMPLITWSDGSHKYLHVDVHGLERYISRLRHYIISKLQRRLSWLQSGSRVPFGLWTESRVLVVVDSSHDIMREILRLQQHFKLLLEEQLAYVKEFNLVGYVVDKLLERLWTHFRAGFRKFSQGWEGSEVILANPCNRS